MRGGIKTRIDAPILCRYTGGRRIVADPARHCCAARAGGPVGGLAAGWSEHNLLALLQTRGLLNQTT